MRIGTEDVKADVLRTGFLLSSCPALASSLPSKQSYYEQDIQHCHVAIVQHECFHRLR